mmetsp:Transcript_53754/g.96292  ORF Transcript_53754/g.96292 Transcript_53754/m.96292 type:complete len:262 (-) Transcript_53754:722-1507(-)
MSCSCSSEKPRPGKAAKRASRNFLGTDSWAFASFKSSAKYSSKASLRSTLIAAETRPCTSWVKALHAERSISRSSWLRPSADWACFRKAVKSSREACQALLPFPGALRALSSGSLRHSRRAPAIFSISATALLTARWRLRGSLTASGGDDVDSGGCSLRRLPSRASTFNIGAATSSSCDRAEESSLARCDETFKANSTERCSFLSSRSRLSCSSRRFCSCSAALTSSWSFSRRTCSEVTSGRSFENSRCTSTRGPDLWAAS